MIYNVNVIYINICIYIYIYIYRVNKKKLGLVAFWPILVIFFLQNVMAANIIENFKNFEIFLLFQGGQKKFFFRFFRDRENF